MTADYYKDLTIAQMCFGVPLLNLDEKSAILFINLPVRIGIGHFATAVSQLKRLPEVNEI